ncbi:VCBS repeat-containing protein [Caloranaerobacter azorensis]|uniref:VCBS repeat-containing protein n=1 Tax=Caloranaerobacter azorensis TaxID=116090 RepID=A0A6P1YFS7_9FIRM|nr:VCBS repeat-containing protein [Caloranaerobacter azorensis]QIB27947.1 VCBS repeat-containing protein [Caloranaerobacter azorensis]
MYLCPFYPLNQMNANRIFILDFKQGDVNGDLIIDNVYLIGEKPYGIKSPFVDNITILIQDGRTNIFYRIIPKENAGYNPTIFLGDFTGNKVNDILISIDSGGSGGYAFYYIYSFMNNSPKKIFDYEKFNQKYTYEVIYKDYYEVEVRENNTKKYIIDIKYKGKDYLSEIYDAKGKLKEPIKGWVNPLGGLYPIDFQRDGTYELYAVRRIAGRYNADNLGYVQTSLKWNGKDFTPFFQTVGILG